MEPGPFRTGMATMLVSLSCTIASGTPPSRSRQPTSAVHRSPTVRPNVKTVACAPEWGSVSTRPKASLVTPLPTGTMTPVCHQSSWPTSPGRYDVRWKARAARKPGRTRARCSFRMLMPPAYPERRRWSRMTVAGASASVSSRAAISSTNGSTSEPLGGRTYRGGSRTQQPDDRRAAHAESSRDGALRQALAMEQSLDLGPVLHSIHSSLPRCRRCLVGPRVPCETRWGVQVSAGGECSVFTRRRHSCQWPSESP